MDNRAGLTNIKISKSSHTTKAVPESSMGFFDKKPMVTSEVRPGSYLGDKTKDSRVNF